jgi:Ca2+/Na+ antiporter
MDNISDIYLSSAITKISKKLKLSEAMAGATLLAFSNGATDIITIVVASGNEVKKGDELAIGSIFGASMFSFTLVLAYVIHRSRKDFIDKVN